MRNLRLSRPTPALFVALLPTVCGLLAGCGQKGDLILRGADDPPAIEAIAAGDENDEQETGSSDE